MKKPRTTARSLVLAARALARAAKELERAGRFHEKDIVDIYARLLTPGGSRLDRDTRLAKVEDRLRASMTTTDSTGAILVREALAEINILRGQERE